MNLFILSELHPTNKFVGYTVNHDLEEILGNTFNAQFLYPLPNHHITLFKQYKLSDNRIPLLQRVRHRTFKSWFDLDAELPTLGNGPNILLVLGFHSTFLLSMHTLGSILDKFDIRIAYLTDIFDPNYLDRSVIPHLDYLFVISAELADQVRRIHSIDVSFLPLATNTLNVEPLQTNRHIDMMNYGRTNSHVHHHLQQHFSQLESKRIYFHSTFCTPYVENPKEHMVLLTRMLSRTKISLCFEPSDTERFHGYSPLLYRWFEAWSTGCTIAGTRPLDPSTHELLDWKNSTIEIPDNPSDWVPFFEALLDDESTLLETSRRNYYECRLRHDWRYRIQDMFKAIEVPIPEQLWDEISYLRNQYCLV
jgi:hypothetical protein